MLDLVHREDDFLVFFGFAAVFALVFDDGSHSLNLFFGCYLVPPFRLCYWC